MYFPCTRIVKFIHFNLPIASLKAFWFIAFTAFIFMRYLRSVLFFGEGGSSTNRWRSIRSRLPIGVLIFLKHTGNVLNKIPDERDLKATRVPHTGIVRRMYVISSGVTRNYSVKNAWTTFDRKYRIFVITKLRHVCACEEWLT